MYPYDDPADELYQSQAKILPLPPAQTASMLSQVGTGLLGGLGYVGDVLDKTLAGRGIRGLLEATREKLYRCYLVATRSESPTRMTSSPAGIS